MVDIGTIHTCEFIKNNGSKCRRKCKDSLCWQHNFENTETLDCAICREVVGKHKKFNLECKHYYHKKCLSRWIKKGTDTCPMCRKELTSYELCVLGFKKYDTLNILIELIDSLLSDINVETNIVLTLVN